MKTKCNYDNPLQTYITMSYHEQEAALNMLDQVPLDDPRLTLSNRARDILRLVKKSLSNLENHPETKTATGCIDYELPRYIRKLLYMSNPGLAVQHHQASADNNIYRRAAEGDAAAWNKLFRLATTRQERQCAARRILRLGRNDVERICRKYRIHIPYNIPAANDPEFDTAARMAFPGCPTKFLLYICDKENLMRYPEFK